MIKDHESNNNNSRGLEIFADFVNSLSEPVSPDFKWHAIPKDFGVNELGPKLRRLGIEAIPQDALFSPAKVTNFETELDQMESGLQLLDKRDPHHVILFKSELWRPGEETRRPFLGVLRSPLLPPSDYKMIMSMLLAQVNMVRYINNQSPIPALLRY